MKDEKYKITKLDGEEYLKLAKIAEDFINKGRSEKNPKFVIVMGGPAVGKSTEIKNKYDEGYVFVDSGAIYLRVTDNETKEVERANEYCETISDMILTQAVNDKKNIVIELIGDKEEYLGLIINMMTERGYKVELVGLTGDVMECYQRHLRQEKEGRDDISCVHTQDGTIQMFINYFNKDE